jgi:hypothetical protein
MVARCRANASLNRHCGAGEAMNDVLTATKASHFNLEYTIGKKACLIDILITVIIQVVFDNLSNPLQGLSEKASPMLRARLM